MRVTNLMSGISGATALMTRTPSHVACTVRYRVAVEKNSRKALGLKIILSYRTVGLLSPEVILGILPLLLYLS
jgi:hypothetical protein